MILGVGTLHKRGSIQHLFGESYLILRQHFWLLDRGCFRRLVCETCCICSISRHGIGLNSPVEKCVRT